MSGDETRRTYSSPLRKSRASRTRDLILDALTELLANHRVDEVSTKQIAELAGVSQPTVYRHFPDRAALVEGLADRIEQQVVAEGGHTPLETLEDWALWAEAAFQAADSHLVEVTAEAVMNADPRRVSRASRRRSEAMMGAVARSLPELDDRDIRRVAALVRMLVSSQSWLRAREEFGVDGTESGPLVRWAISTLVAEIRRGSGRPLR